MFARWLNILLGLWLIVAPVALGYPSDVARINDTWCGLAVAFFAALAGAIPRLRFVGLALGVWLVVAPFALGFRHAGVALGNDVVVGVAVFCLSLIPSRIETIARDQATSP